MNNLTYARDDAELRRLLKGRDLERLWQRGVIFGTPNQVADRLAEYAEAGVQRIMLQWLELDDLDRLEDFARRVMPEFA